MARRYYQKLVVLAKVETVYGTDAAPTGAENAMQMTDVTITPLAGTDVSRDLLLPYLGSQGVELVANYATLTGKVEVAGAGAAGTVPAYGALLRACGMAEVVTASTSVAYSPVSAAFDSVTLHFNRDGVRHVLLGARGTVTMDIAPSTIPRFTFTFTGLLGTITDTVLPSADLTDFFRPAVVSKANTILSLHGWTAIAESVSLDLGNDIQQRVLIGAEAIELVDRSAKGSAVVEATSLATIDWFARAKARTRGTLSLRQGTIAGNIVEITAPAVEIGRPTEGQTQKIVNYTLPLMLCPSTGNDEITITVR